MTRKQDSPPVWTQEAYRPPRSKYSIYYPVGGGRVPHPWAGGYPSQAHPDLVRRRVGIPFWGTPIWDWGTPCLGLGYPPGKAPGTSHWGNLQEGTWDQSLGTPEKGHGTNGSILKWRWGTPLTGVDGHTPVKTLPSHIPLEMLAVIRTVGQTDGFTFVPHPNDQCIIRFDFSRPDPRYSQMKLRLDGTELSDDVSEWLSREIAQLSWKYCKACHMMAPPRSHHCKICKKCVLKRDHHCFLTGTDTFLSNIVIAIEQFSVIPVVKGEVFWVKVKC